jgi:tetratricopeptide (TPR) repeat protein
MDPISGILAFAASEKALEMISGGVLGNRADSLVCLAFGPMWNYLKEAGTDQVGSNHDLERAGVAAYLDATGLMVEEALRQVSGWKAHFPCLGDASLRSLRRGVKQARKNLPRLPFTPIPDAQLFLIQETSTAKARHDLMRAALENRLRTDCRAWGVGYSLPETIESLLSNGWTHELKNGLIVERRWHDLVAIAFVEQLKRSQPLATVFQAKLLAEIHARDAAAAPIATFDGFQRKWKEVEVQLGRIEATVTQIDDRTARIEEIVAKLLAQQQAPAEDSPSKEARLRDKEGEIARLREQIVAFVANASPPVGKQIARFSAGDATAWHEIKRLKLEEVETRVKFNAEDLRQLASLALIAKDRGEATLEEVVELWERAQAGAPNYHWGWVELRWLYMEKGDLPKAESAAEKALATAGDDRERSIAFTELGDVEVARGDLAAAQQRFAQSLGIRENLARANPTSADAQRDLSVSLNKLGDVEVARGDLAAAQQRFAQSLGIRENLARANPTSADAQCDLIVSNVKLATVTADCRYWERALSIAVSLQQAGLLAPRDAQMVGILEIEIARCQAAKTP